jgi:phosphate-selective porin
LDNRKKSIIFVLRKKLFSQKTFFYCNLKRILKVFQKKINPIYNKGWLLDVEIGKKKVIIENNFKNKRNLLKQQNKIFPKKLIRLLREILYKKYRCRMLYLYKVHLRHIKRCLFKRLMLQLKKYYPTSFLKRLTKFLIYLIKIFQIQRFQIYSNRIYIIINYYKNNSDSFSKYIYNSCINLFKSFMFNKIMSNTSMLNLSNAGKYVGIFVCAISMQNITAKAQEEVELTPIEKLEQTTESQGSAIKKLQKLRISGYIQTQYQYAETDADGINFKLANRANAYDQAELQSFGHFGIRRGRIKFTYEDGIVQGVFQPDFTDKGLSFKDVYLSIKDPWIGTISLKSGIFDRPFGHEISYSSSTRESPERSRIFQTLFPDERDLGTMLTLQAAKTSEWNFLKLEAGLFAGNGIRSQFDNHFDFIGHLSASKTFNDISIGGGVSAYLGGVMSNNDSLYTWTDTDWVLDNTNNKGKISTRQYIGVDFQVSMITEMLGLTQLRAEYIFGKHPGNSDGAYDFKLSALPTGPTYDRNITGGYVILTQDIGTTPFTLVLKYDWYDPNTDISGDDIKKKGEIAMNNIGAGLMWRINNNLRLTAYYDIVSNETTDKLKDTIVDEKVTKYGYEGNRKDNVLTLRLQYKF